MKHIRLPFTLNRLLCSVYSGSTCLKSFPPKLISQPLQNLSDFLWIFVSKRDILEVAIDVSSTYEGMVIAFANEVKVNMIIILHEIFKLIGC